MSPNGCVISTVFKFIMLLIIFCISKPNILNIELYIILYTKKIYSMSEAQFVQYSNIVVFATEWRKYKLLSKPMELSEFRKTMQADQFVTLDCSNTKNKTLVTIYLFDKDSKYTASSQDLRKLLKKNKDRRDLILITYEPLGTYCQRVINNEFKQMSIYIYRHEIFSLIAPKGPLCYPHRIMSIEEVKSLTNNDLCCYLTNLPKIYDEDPMCVWIGAKRGDVIEITMLSDISGETIQYRVVVSKSGKIIGYRESTDDTDDTKKTIDAKADITEIEEDDEVQEHRENQDIADDDAEDDAAEVESTVELNDDAE